MIKRYFALVSALMTMLSLHAQPPANCSGSSAPTLLIAGDSWAQYMADDDVFNQALSMYGHGDKYSLASTYEVVIALWGSGSPDPWDYTVSGSEARQWANEANYPYLQNVRNALIANPSVKTVFLSIGGNDILAARCYGGWYENMDNNGAGNEQNLLNTIMGNTQYIVEQILAVRPDIQVIIGSYDYPNFNVQGAWGGCAWLCNLCDLYACEERKQLSYSPVVTPSASCTAATPAALITDAGINQMMRTIEQRRQTYADGHPRVLYDNSIGLMHRYYGDGSSGPGVLPAPLGITPYTPGGNPNTPSLRDNFRLVNISAWFDAPADPIHLTTEGYTYKAKNMMDNLLFSKVRGNPNHTFFSEGSKDGYIFVYDGNQPQSVHNNGIRMGDNGVDFWLNNNEYYGFLSFNTDALPDNATIEGASIYLIRSSENDNPFLHNDRNPVLDIKSGYFGSNDQLQLTDWNAAASAANIGCFNGSAPADKYAVRIDLQPAALSHINKSGQTQFRLKFDYADYSPEYINFYDGDQIGAVSGPSDEEQRMAIDDTHYYTEFTLHRKKDGTEEIVSKSNPVEKPAGMVLEKVKTASWLDDDSTVVTQYKMLLALEHEGLAHVMGTKAPFLDVWYSAESLPVVLEQFDAQKEGNTVALTWNTATEEKSLYFEVQRSTNGVQWQTLGKVAAAGSSAVPQYYRFIDERPAVTNYYRLNMVNEGDSGYSDVRYVAFDRPRWEVEAGPNPCTDVLCLSIAANAKDMHCDLRVTDLLGRVVDEQHRVEWPASGSYTIPTGQWPPGAYYIQISSEEIQQTLKILKK